MKKALITGILGQDGSYLTEFLFKKNYQVHGLVRSLDSKVKNESNWKSQWEDKIHLHQGSINDRSYIRNIIESIRPEEVYHLATGHEVKLNDEDYLKTRATDLDGTFFLLSALADLCPQSRLFYASSSNIFGKAAKSPQNEETPYHPASVYAVTKVASMNFLRLFREQKNLFCCSGILFNHESPRRDSFFLTRKICQTAVMIKLGKIDQLHLGDLQARRDWGFAGDYVEAMWLMLQNTKAEDFVIGTGVTHSVTDVLQIAFTFLDLDWRTYVKVNEQLLRLKEEVEVVADARKIHSRLGWVPKLSFEKMIQDMVFSELQSQQSLVEGKT